MTTSQNHKKKPILIGNSYPLSLVRCEVTIRPETRARLKETMGKRVIHSFWGHANTLAAATAFAGVDLTPATERPALALTPDGLPTLDGVVFRECWVLSPDYAPGFRPRVGEEVPEDVIEGWQVLRLNWSKSV